MSDLQSYIKQAFAAGLTYDDAVQLCLRLYCSVDGLPEILKEQCHKSNLAETFAILYATGFIKRATASSVIYGANFHDVVEKGHWIEVIASIFKNGKTVDTEQGDLLFKRFCVQLTDIEIKNIS